MTRYWKVEAEDASRFLKARRLNDGGVTLDQIVRQAGAGEEMPPEIVHDLLKQLVKLKKEFPEKLHHRDPKGGKFESEACALVHTGLRGVDRRVLADPGFWTWLALGPLVDILEWRFAAVEGPVEAKNYGVGSAAENLFFRLWLRGEIGRIEGSEPYTLAVTGDQDLWRSHLLRQGYTNARSVAQALLRLQAGLLTVGGATAERLAAGDERDGVRMLAKRLRRMRANVVFEYLSPTQADALVFELATNLKKSK